VFGLVPTDGISWQGHLFGAIGGVVAARVLDSMTKERWTSANVGFTTL
jgi:membrane associated rhomboid family serine protease